MTDDRGFSLLEALIGIAILTGVVASAFSLARSGIHAQDRSVASARATLAAEAILARVGLDIPLAAQDLQGRLADGSRWQLAVKPVQSAGSPNVFALFDVEVEVTPEGGSGVALYSQVSGRIER